MQKHFEGIEDENWLKAIDEGIAIIKSQTEKLIDRPKGKFR